MIVLILLAVLVCLTVPTQQTLAMMVVSVNVPRTLLLKMMVPAHKPLLLMSKTVLEKMNLLVLLVSSLTTVSGTLLQLQLPVPVRMALKLSLPALRSLLPAHSPSR